MKGTTGTGFEYELSDEALDDYELFEMLCEIDSGKFALVAPMVVKLLGEDQAKRLKEHIRVGGRVSTRKMMDEIKSIFEGNSTSKNS